MEHCLLKSSSVETSSWVPVEFLFQKIRVHLSLALAGIGAGLVVDWQIGKVLAFYM